MSTDTPRPERVTLSDEERHALWEALSEWHTTACDAECLRPAVERILAAREQALREEIAGPLERVAALLDKEVAESVEANVRSELGNVRCLDCDLRYGERDQYGCGESGRGHNYDTEELADAEASARADVQEYVTLAVADLRDALRGETR